MMRRRVNFSAQSSPGRRKRAFPRIALVVSSEAKLRCNIDVERP
jgi:hypothetical protein